MCLITFWGLGAIPAACPADAVLEMSLPHNAIYTPGDIRIDVMVTPAAKLAGPYRVRVIAFVARDVVHERTMSLRKGGKASWELSFPEVRIVTEVRCRTELFLGDAFVEACERPVHLWPRRCPCGAAHPRAEFWAFDPSGVVQKLLSEFGLAASNAAFQAVRDFGSPRVVFLGEGLDPCDIRMILERVRMTEADTIMILPRQRQFPEELQVSITRDQDPCDNIAWERGSALLEGLAARDLTGMLRGAAAVNVKRRPGRSVTSWVTGAARATDEICSYLGVVQEENHAILYCQLPIADGQDPRQMVLLRNLLRVAGAWLRPAPGHEATDLERVKP